MGAIHPRQQTQLLPSRHAASRPSLRGSLLGLLPLSQMVALVTIAFVFMLGITYFFHPFAIDNSYATDSDTTVNVASNLSISATDVSISDIPDANGSWLTGTSNVVVSTNNETGYKLYMSSSSDQVDLVNSDNNKYKIENLSSETTEATFKSDSNLMNHYGFTHDNNGDNTDLGQITSGTYLPVTSIDDAKLIKATEEKQNISTTNVTFATKVDRSIPAGEYANTITFTAITNPTTPTELADGLNMQDVTQEACANTPLYSESGTTYTLTDSRDNNTYKVRKLADGNCWMVQNLRLINKAISSSDSNVSSDFTIPVSSSSWCTQYSLATCVNTQKAYYDNNTTYGTYYNWYTATASTGTYARTSGNATSSICPKSGSGNDSTNSWHLPTGTNTGEWYKMTITGYGYKDQSTSSPNVADWTTAAANLPFSGNFGPDHSSVINGGSRGYFWSSTAYNNNDAYLTYVDSNKILYAGTYYDSKYYGLSVRYVLSSE